MFNMSFYFTVIIGDDQKDSSPFHLGSSNILEADFWGNIEVTLFMDLTTLLLTYLQYTSIHYCQTLTNVKRSKRYLRDLRKIGKLTSQNTGSGKGLKNG
jgi:hypothetical protein